jgi:deoxyhypusine synthase
MHKKNDNENNGFEKVNQIDLKKDMKVSELTEEMSKSGVMGAGRIAKAVEIYKDMKKNNAAIFFGLAGAMVPGGMKNIIIDLIEKGYISVLVSTGANLTHDVIEALGYSHLQGKSDADDAELRKKGIDRIYDSFMPSKVYVAMEKFFNQHFDELSRQKNIKDFLWKLGSLLPDDRQNKSILKTCFAHKVPLFCPAIADSGIGLMIWSNIAQNKSTDINAFDDLKEIIDIAWTNKVKGVVYIGGGVPKNYIQQAMQFSTPAQFGIQITMDRPEHGGSSGAELREGISWGKISEKGKFTDVICDATIALPLIAASVFVE